MRRRVLKIFLAALFLCVAVRALAAPARPGIIKINQPDGSIVEVTIKGNEFGHVMTTRDGCAVTRDRDGYLCYLRFEADGSRVNTGVRVGHDADGTAEAASRAIPYSRISAMAAQRRRSAALSRSLRLQSVDTKASTTHRCIILLAQFSDLSFANDRSSFVDLITKKGYNANGASGSALDYFNDQFQGAAEFEFEVGPVVTLSKGYAYYGTDDKDGYDLHPDEAVAEACRLSDAQVDFSKYDYVFVFYAGGNPADGGADDNHIWPHSWDLREAKLNLVLDGKVIGPYAMTSELMKNNKKEMEFASIGTFCHEYSHTLGLNDLYDTDYEDSGYSPALWGSTGIMDSGNYNNDGKTPPAYNAIDLESIGLVTPETLVYGDYTLEPVSSSRRVLRLETDKADEYFLFEARQATGWDRYIRGSGLLVYHVDKSYNKAEYSKYYDRTATAAERWMSNEVNCNLKHQCADLVEADLSAVFDPEHGVVETDKVFFPSDRTSSLSPKSNSGFKYWSGGLPEINLTKITKSNGTVTFTVCGPLVVDKKDVYQDAVILNWHTDLDEYADIPAYVSWSSGGQTHQVKVEPYESGLFSYTVEGLQSGTEYPIKISVGGSGSGQASTTVTVTTKSLGGQPYIYVSDASRNSAGKFTVCTKIPLRVYNLRNAKSVSWYWDGSGITAGKDGYLELTKDGILKAVVTYKDGSEEIFIKKISIR